MRGDKLLAGSGAKSVPAFGNVAVTQRATDACGLGTERTARFTAASDGSAVEGDDSKLVVIAMKGSCGPRHDAASGSTTKSAPLVLP